MPKRHRIATLVSTLGFLFLLNPALGVTPLTTRRLATSLAWPTFVAASPGDSTRLFILQKSGQIRILDLAAETLLPDPFLDLDPLIVNPTGTNDERGLLGIAFHPNYASNGFFYVNYINNSSNTVVARYSRAPDDPNQADPDSAVQIYTLAQPFTNHNGGWLGFGPDGYLYCAQGDGGSSCDPGARAQDITSQLLGKMLRLDVNSDDFPADDTRFYSIPPTNPFLGVSGDDEIWAYGLRNPWRCSFDRSTGDLWIADVGQRSWEEIDFQPAASTAAVNYGWDCMEANHCSADILPEGSLCIGAGCTCGEATLMRPIHEFAHSVTGTDNCSISGGYVYRGPAIPSLQGAYFFADYCSARIWSVRYNGAAVTELIDRTTELDPPGAPAIGSIVSFGEDAAGELYIVETGTGFNGELFKIVPNCTIAFAQQPQSKSVCSGTQVVFTSLVSGASGAVTYTWKRNGAAFGAPNSPILTLPSVAESDEASYTLTAEDSCVPITSSPAFLTVNPSPMPDGDIDGDCDKDSADIDLFVQVLLGLDLNPDHISRANLDDIGVPDGRDVQPFVAAHLIF